MLKKPHSDPDACTSGIMAMQDALQVLGGKWRLLIIHYLMTRLDQDNTFKKIEKDLNGISAKVLSQELKELELNKIVTRSVNATLPITVSYQLTPYGQTIEPILQQLVQWGQNHRIQLFTSASEK